MKNPGKTHLRLHTEEAAVPASAPRSGDEVAEVLACFAAATGWAPTSTMSKRRVVVGEDAGADVPPQLAGSLHRKPGHQGPRWTLTDAAAIDGVLDADGHTPAVRQADAQSLMAAIERLVERLEKAEGFVREHQAARAGDIAVVRQADESKEVADRLLTILASSGASIGATAAAIYLLDETTSELAMRACWNLPVDRLMAAPRQLRGSLADLEALLGNAVLLDDLEAVSEGWPSPESFASAIVVPIGSVAMPQGTIWFWSDRKRKYDPPQIEVANLAAGRVMSELEHSVLGAEVKESRRVVNQLDRASEAQAARLPGLAAIHRDIEMAGWSLQEGPVGGAFHDWDINPRSQVVAAMGQAVCGGALGALAAASAQSVVRCGWQQGMSESQILRALGDQLFELGEEDWAMHLTALHLCGESGRGCLANGGMNQWLIASHRGIRPIALAARPLACNPHASSPVSRFVLQPGEVMVGMSATLVQQLNLPDAIRAPGETQRQREDAASKLRRHRRALSRSLDQHPLLRRLQAMCDEPASVIADHFMRHLPTLLNASSPGVDRSLIVIRNARKCV